MSQNFLIGDCHFGHNGISQKFRTQFETDTHHDWIIHTNILKCSGKRNHLYMLGDIFFKTNQFWRLDEYAKVFGTVTIAMGNHDHKSLAKYAAQFDNVTCVGIIKKFGMWLSHAPVHPQELYRAYSVHGHVHSNTVPDARYFNCSCENIDYAPISLQDVRERLQARMDDFGDFCPSYNERKKNAQITSLEKKVADLNNTLSTAASIADENPNLHTLARLLRSVS